MRAPLSALYGPQTTKPNALSDLLSLPLPPSPLSETLQILISTYLSHALTVLSQSQPQSQWQALSTTLQTTPTLLQWLPHLPSLPQKHKDSILTRAYSMLAKLPSPSSNHTGSSNAPRMTFELRAYALQCLLHTTPGSLDPNTFWDQTTKFCVSFVKASSVSSSSPAPLASPAAPALNAPAKTREDEVVSAVLRVFGVLVGVVGTRVDREDWMSGRGFVGFCEYWMGFAKRVSYPSTFVFHSFVVPVRNEHCNVQLLNGPLFHRRAISQSWIG